MECPVISATGVKQHSCVYVVALVPEVEQELVSYIEKGLL